MSGTVIYATLVLDNGEPKIEDHCYVFNMLDDSERVIRVPTTVVDLSTNQMVALEDGTMVKLIVYDELDNQPNNDEPYLQSCDEQNTSNIQLSSCLSQYEPDNTVAEWDDKGTKLLIDLYRSKKHDVEQRKIKNLKKMWELIQQEMLKYGFGYTPQQCENKWKTLERSFKNVTENKQKTGRGRKTCPYLKELSEIFLKRHSIVPVCTMGTGRPVLRNEENKDPEEEPAGDEAGGEEAGSTDDESSIASRKPLAPLGLVKTTTTKTPKPRSRTMYSELRELRLAIQKHTADKQRMAEKNYKQKGELIAQMKLKNDLLQKYLERNN